MTKIRKRIIRSLPLWSCHIRLELVLKWCNYSISRRSCVPSISIILSEKVIESKNKNDIKYEQKDEHKNKINSFRSFNLTYVWGKSKKNISKSLPFEKRKKVEIHNIYLHIIHEYQKINHYDLISLSSPLNNKIHLFNLFVFLKISIIFTSRNYYSYF